MRIHVIDLVGVDAATAQGIEHTAPGAVAIRRSDVMSIGAHAIADKLAIDARPALTGMLVFFKYQCARKRGARSEEHTSELQSLMRISYAVFCLKKKK